MTNPPYVDHRSLATKYNLWSTLHSKECLKIHLVENMISTVGGVVLRSLQHGWRAIFGRSLQDRQGFVLQLPQT